MMSQCTVVHCRFLITIHHVNQKIWKEKIGCRITSKKSMRVAVISRERVRSQTGHNCHPWSLCCIWQCSLCRRMHSQQQPMQSPSNHSREGKGGISKSNYSASTSRPECLLWGLQTGYIVQEKGSPWTLRSFLNSSSLHPPPQKDLKNKQAT